MIHKAEGNPFAFAWYGVINVNKRFTSLQADFCWYARPAF
jgi:hypothetical protein